MMQVISRLVVLELKWHQAAITTVFAVPENQKLSLGRRIVQAQRHTVSQIW